MISQELIMNLFDQEDLTNLRRNRNNRDRYNRDNDRESSGRVKAKCGIGMITTNGNVCVRGDTTVGKIKGGRHSVIDIGGDSPLGPRRDEESYCRRNPRDRDCRGSRGSRRPSRRDDYDDDDWVLLLL